MHAYLTIAAGLLLTGVGLILGCSWPALSMPVGLYMPILGMIVLGIGIAFVNIPCMPQMIKSA